MNIKTLFISTIAVTSIGTMVVPQNIQAAPALTAESHLGIDGISPVYLGMSTGEAETAAGRKIIIHKNRDSSSCVAANFDGLDGVHLMLIDGIVERIDIDNPKVLTVSGARIGDTEEQIRQLYPGQIKIAPHPYKGDKYIIILPTEQQEKSHRIIFETSQGQVSSFRSGRLPAVEYVEGCL